MRSPPSAAGCCAPKFTILLAISTSPDSGVMNLSSVSAIIFCHPHQPATALQGPPLHLFVTGPPRFPPFPSDQGVKDAENLGQVHRLVDHAVVPVRTVQPQHSPPGEFPGPRVVLKALRGQYG